MHSICTLSLNGDKKLKYQYMRMWILKLDTARSHWLKSLDGQKSICFMLNMFLILKSTVAKEALIVLVDV